MRIRMLTLSAGPAGVWKPGDVVDVGEDQADELVGGGYAVAIDDPPVALETMMAPDDGEHAAIRARARRARRARKEPT